MSSGEELEEWGGDKGEGERRGDRMEQDGTGRDVWCRGDKEFICGYAQSSTGRVHFIPRLKAFVIFWSSLISAQQMPDLRSKWPPRARDTVTAMIDNDTRRGLSRALIKEGDYAWNAAFRQRNRSQETWFFLYLTEFKSPPYFAWAG